MYKIVFYWNRESRLLKALFFSPTLLSCFSVMLLSIYLLLVLKSNARERFPNFFQFCLKVIVQKTIYTSEWGNAC
jgi:hypothetical protein